MKNKIIVNFCPTGMVPQKSHSPHVPISPQEIIEQTHQAYELGISIAHLHARLSNGEPTYQKNVYREIFEGVKKHCPDLVICGSTSGRNFNEFEKRSEVIELQPYMCSLTLSSLNFLQQASINTPDMIFALAQKMEEFGVHPELECFDLGMINVGKYLINKGVVKGPVYWNLLFGNIAGFQAELPSISTALSEIPGDHFVSLGGLGAFQLKANSLAIALGYGVRVGLEDNLWWDSQKSRLCTNFELVKRVHQLIELNGREYFPPAEFGALGFYNQKRGSVNPQNVLNHAWNI